METPINGPDYKDINITVNYESDPKYDPEGLSWLYSTTKNFMDLILSEAIPENVITVHEDNKIDIHLDGHVSNILTQYAYVIVICLLILIFAMTMLSTGLISGFKCCCGFGPISHDERKGTYKKNCLIILVIACGAFITFGGVCAFLANERIQRGVKDLPEDIRKSVRDAEKFLNLTNQQIDILLVENFDQFTEWIDNDIEDCSNKIRIGIDEIITQMSVDNIFNIADKFVAIRNNVKKIIDSTESTRSLATSLTNIEKELNEALLYCGQGIKECMELLVNIGVLDVTVPDTRSLEQIFESIWAIPNKIADANVQFSKTKTKIADTIGSSQKQARVGINETGYSIKESVNEISLEIQTLNDFLPNTQSHSDANYTFLDAIQDFVDDYDGYRHYINVAICSILFFIVGLLAVGMICGFGKKNFFKQRGHLFLLCGTTMLYIIAVVIAAITLIYFLVGITTHQGLCKPLQGPITSRFIELIDQFDLAKYGLNTSISKILDSIREDESAYNTFNLRSNFDVDQVDKYLSNFQTALEEVEQLAKTTDLDNFQIMAEEEISNLKTISEPNFSLINNFLSQMNMVTKSGIIDEINQKLDSILKLDWSQMKDLETKLKKCKADLTAKMDEINIAGTTTSNMEAVVNNLKEELKLDNDSFDIGKNNLISRIEDAQLIMRRDGPKMIEETVKKLSTVTVSVCENYINRVQEGIETEVGRCRPLDVALDATLTSICDKTVMQINIYWFILLWTMIILLPTAIMSAKLSNFYKSATSQKSPKLKSSNDQVTNKSKRKKLKRTEENSKLPDVWSENADIITGYDILSGKWQQYPLPVQPHNSITPEQYGRPPSYILAETKSESVPSPANYKPRKQGKSGKISELSSVSNGNADMIFNNDILLHKWVQYPPPGAAHHFNEQEEYKRPPAYYLEDRITRLRNVGPPQETHENIVDDLSKWTQYPVRNVLGNPIQSRNRKFWL